MAQPRRSTVTIDDVKFNAVTASIGVQTRGDHSGMPVMGSLQTHVDVVIDMHDDKNLPFSAVKKLFDLSNVVTRDKIKSVKIEFWKDEDQEDALCSFKFKGWIAHWQASSDSDNHTLVIHLQPALDQGSFSDLSLSN